MMNIDDLSSDEKDAVEELRMRMKPVLERDQQDDINLFHRFLKARDFDVDKAELMLRKHIIWRKAFQVDSIVDTFVPKEVFLKYVEPRLIGFNKEGYLVRYSPVLDIRDVIKSFKMNDYIKHWIWYSERDQRLLMQENEKTGRNADKKIMIINLEQLTFATTTHKASLDFLSRVVNLTQDNFPERLKVAYIINAPAFFVILFSLLKRIMSNALLEKIHVYGQTGWKTALLEHIDANILPAFLGGNRTDPDGDPLCKSFIFHGGKIPPKYFLSNEERTFKNLENVKRKTVPQNAKRNVLVEVKNRESVIQWEFETKSKDIGFGLFLQESDQDLKEVLPVRKFYFTDGTETGSFRSEFPGTYVITFDNSYSWLSSKEVSYCITISEPAET